MDPWKAFTNQFSVEDRPAILSIVAALRSQGVTDLSELSALTTEQFAITLASITGDDPLAAMSDAETLQKAEEMLAAARRVLSGAKAPVRNLRGDREKPAPSKPSVTTQQTVTDLKQEDKTFVVKGKVSLPDGAPGIGLIVRAWDKDLRHEELLGETLTGKSGSYEIHYSADQFRRAEKESADLVVRVFGPPSKEETAFLVTSQLISNARAVETVALVVNNPQGISSEFAQLIKVLTPLLERLPFSQLEENEEHQDFSFLAGETGMEPRLIELLTAAHQLADQTKLRAEIFYGLARAGLPTDLPALLQHDEHKWTEALDKAVAANVISPLSADERSSVVTQLRSLAQLQSLDRSLGPGSASLGTILDTAGLSRDMQLRFLDAHDAQRGDEPAFWDRLGAQGFSSAQIASTRLSVELGALAGNNSRLVAALRKYGITSTSDLATLKTDDWVAMGKQAGMGTEQVDQLELKVAAHFPNARLQSRLVADPPSSLPAIAGFFKLKDARQSFDLGTTEIDTYLPAQGLNDPALGEQLKVAQRVFKLTSDETEFRALLKSGFSSAAEIVASGRDSFHNAVGSQLGSRTDDIYDRAERSWAGTITVAADPTLTLTPRASDTDAAPTWRNLFGAHDLDTCDASRSVVSPAAYLADLLTFLGRSDVNAGTTTLRDLLFARRPDINFLELSHANAETELTEIDLVNELLDQQLAPQPNFDQTTHDKIDLAVLPEYTSAAASALLASGTPAWEPYPEQVERYLGLLGISRPYLIRLLAAPPSSVPHPGEVTEIANLATKLNATYDGCISVTADEASSGAATGTSYSLKALGGPPTQALAGSLLQAIQTRWRDDWRTRIKPIHDTLREQRRDALVAYLLKRDGLSSASELSERLLIDVEVGSGRTTTRIAQAITAAQQFVQRVILHREDSGSTLSPAGIQQWEWLGHYESWKTNRLIFLQPENWLRPELRDDKSPQFKELESDLVQNQITPEYVEKTVRSYLVKLDEISRLQVCAVCQNYDDEGETVHVFARTRGVPNIYYYRRRVGGIRWTAWEKVDLDIEGDQLIPAVFNRRLYLFWPIFNERPELPFRKLEELLAQMLRLQLSIGTAAARGAYEMARRILDALPDLIDKILHPTQTDNDLHLPGAGTQIFPPPPSPKDVEKALENLPLPRINSRPSTAQTPGPQLSDGPTPDTEIATKLGDMERDLASGDIEAFFGHAHELVNLLFVSAQGLLPSKELSVQLAWSDLKDGIWSPKKLSHEAIQFADLSSVLPHKQRAFDFSVTSGDSLRIGCYLPNTNRNTQGENVEVGYFELANTNSVLSATTLSDVNTVDLDTFLGEIGATFSDDVNRFIAGHPVSVDDSRNSLLRRSVETILPGATGQPIQLIAPLREDLTATTFLDATPLFFMDDNGQTHFGERRTLVKNLSPATRATRFQTFYHPLASRFIDELDHAGVFGLIQQDFQGYPKAWFEERYQPRSVPGEAASTPFPLEMVDFSIDGAYSLYNWELFVHIPLLIASRLTEHKHFQEAQKWLSTVFDPTQREGDAPQRYWRTPALNQSADASLQAQLRSLLDPANDAAASSLLNNQVEAWQRDPFNPFAVARLRPTAFQKAFVLAYLDNLLAWADTIARQDERESVSEATSLYAQALMILGVRPVNNPAQSTVPAPTFAQLSTHVSSPWLRAIEQRLPAIATSASNESLLTTLGTLGSATATARVKSLFPNPLIELERKSDWLGIAQSPSLVSAFAGDSFFCLPLSDRVLSIWSSIELGLLELRSRGRLDDSTFTLLAGASVSAFDIPPPVNALLAATPVHNYRFAFIMQKANEFANEVKAFGGALLAALEKGDAEEMAQLRSTHEIALLDATRNVRRNQLEESRATLESLKQTRNTAMIRRQFYKEIIKGGLNEGETISLNLTLESLIIRLASAAAFLASGVFSLSPNGKLAFVTSLGATYGGDNVQGLSSGLGRALGTSTTLLDAMSALTRTIGEHERRSDEWQFQLDLATSELEQIDKQIAAADLRVRITSLELDNHQLQMQHADAVDDYLVRRKTTNKALYEWTVNRLTSAYSLAYKAALDLAIEAEWSYNFELGLNPNPISPFIGSWDSDHRGLLAGEQLSLGLRAMEAAYLSANHREFEITKHISLGQLNPFALIELKETGKCDFEFPEVLFDLDFAGHWFRRLKTVGLTIPCVVGPYAGINATLTLLSSSVRNTTAMTGTYSDLRNLMTSYTPIQSIATSHAQNDSGLFELAFRDERYLPFEGAGVVSQWRLELPNDFRQFDYDTISDVVLHLRYTARDGREELAEAAVGELKTKLNELMHQSQGRDGFFRMFSARQEFSTVWHKFMNPPTGQDHLLALDISKERFPFLTNGKAIKTKKVELLARIDNASAYEVFVKAPVGGEQSLRLTRDEIVGNLHHGGPANFQVTIDRRNESTPSLTEWRLRMPNTAGLKDLFLLISYSLD